MKPLTSAQSAERSSRSSKQRPARNRHNRPKKKTKMKNPPVVVGPKVPHVGLKDLLVGPKVLPAGQAGHLEGAEDDGPKKA
jgi:hypothetical protein